MVIPKVEKSSLVFSIFEGCITGVSAIALPVGKSALLPVIAEVNAENNSCCNYNRRSVFWFEKKKQKNFWNNF